MSSTCSICSTSLEKEEICGFGCKHIFCKKCLQESIEDTFVTKKKSFLSIQCPEKVIVNTQMGKMKTQCDQFLSTENFNKYASEKSQELLKILMKTIPQDNPTSLADFNYHFNENGQLRNIDTGASFHYITETHYEALGDFIVKEIQNKMVKEQDLVETFLPEETDKDSPKVNIFMSKDALTCEKLMLIIQGSGAVRAGMWARALCLNDSLKTGAILDYIKQARSEGYGVIVLNPNMNTVPKKADPYRRSRLGFLNTKKLGQYHSSEIVEIPGHDSPPQHVISVWDKVVMKSKAKDIVSVSHSAGGHGTHMLIKFREEEVLKRLKAVAFTDSVHSTSRKDTESTKKYLLENSINWVTSKQPLDTKLGVRDGSGCLCLSAGHDTHENTSSSAQTSVFKYLASKIQ